jgi:ubiquinone/menaquinone biosynthesis C-methylase UbiE
MTASIDSTPRFSSRLINGILAIKPLANLAKHQARQMMIKRAESIGVQWTQEATALRARDWTAEFKQVNNPSLIYPNYYVRSFHAYEEGNLGWEPATEVEVAAHAVHARIWPESGAEGDARLRQSYHDILRSQIRTVPQSIVDLGCSVGMSTFTLHALYPESKIMGVDLSPYFLSVAQYRSQSKNQENLPTWLHAPAESTGLPSASVDLVSACLLFHELPQTAAVQIIQEAKRLLRPGGYLALMDMNPKSAIYAQMPPYILTLLKSTEPYMDDYFSFDLERAIAQAGFSEPTLTCNTPRHRVLMAQVE